jgi:CRISPR/Cas system CMR subunit Cmr6 (Cas7 group RAMP superfamily)
MADNVTQCFAGFKYSVDTEHQNAVSAFNASVNVKREALWAYSRSVQQISELLNALGMAVEEKNRALAGLGLQHVQDSGLRVPPEVSD